MAHPYRVLDLSNAKSYKHRHTLVKKVHELLDQRDGYADRAIIVCNEQGRFTAIFSLDKGKGGYIMHYAAHGFMSV